MGKLNEPVGCLDSTSLQVQATAIVIGDNLALLGLASNPIVIHVDEDSGYDNANTDWRGSDHNTEVVTAPEFWEVLIYESFPDSADEHGKLLARSLSAGRQPTRIHDSFHLGGKALETTENSFNGLQNCSGLEAIKRKNVTSGHASWLTTCSDYDTTDV
jgi:hypothetical protein